MRILVLGAGMYVTGRWGSGVGTVLSSIAETSRGLPVEHVTVAARNTENRDIVRKTIQEVNRRLGTKLKGNYSRLRGDEAGALRPLLRNSRFDCAVVSLPDHLHYPYTRILLESGIHCLVVKPLTAKLSEALDLVKRQKEKGLLGVVEFHKRYDESNLFVKKCLSEGQLGQLLYFTMDFSQRVTIPEEIFRDWVSETNVFQYLGVHYVDLVHFLTGFLPARLTASGTRGLLASKGIDNYDSIHVTIHWKDPKGRTGPIESLLSTNWIDQKCTSAMSDQKYKVIGTRGRIECDQKNRGIEWVQDDSGIRHVNPYFSEFLPSPDGGMEFSGYGHRSIRTFLQDVHGILRGGIRPDQLEGIRPTFSQALVSTSVLDAVNQSLAGDSEWIDIHGNPG